MSIFHIKENDTLPIMDALLVDGDGAAVNLTGATVTFRFRDPVGAITSTAATIVDAVTGSVSHTFTAAQTASSGMGIGEFLVDYGAGSVLTLPTQDPLLVQIHPGVGA